jgi:hypothetical protein
MKCLDQGDMPDDGSPLRPMKGQKAVRPQVPLQGASTRLPVSERTWEHMLSRRLAFFKVEAMLRQG